MKIIIALLSMGLLCVGCASNVFVNKTYPVSKIEKIAVLPIASLEDYPRIGASVSNEMVNSLIKYQFRVVERMLVDKIVSEQKLSLSGAIDFNELKEIGKLLSVDALIVGNVERFKPEKSSKISYIPTKEVEKTELYSEKKMYRQEASMAPPPSESTFTDYNLGSIAVSFRLIDVNTGEIIASGSGNESAETSSLAINKLTNKFCKQMRKQFKVSQKGIK